MKTESLIQNYYIKNKDEFGGEEDVWELKYLGLYRENVAVGWEKGVLGNWLDWRKLDSRRDIYFEEWSYYSI